MREFRDRVRDILVHDYFRINQQLVWETVEKDIRPLKSEL